MEDLQRSAGGGGAGFDTELGKQIVGVLFDGVNGGVQNDRDFLIGFSFGDPVENFCLTGCQAKGKQRLRTSISVSMLDPHQRKVSGGRKREMIYLNFATFFVCYIEGLV